MTRDDEGWWDDEVIERKKKGKHECKDRRLRHTQPSPDS